MDQQRDTESLLPARDRFLLLMILVVGVVLSTMIGVAGKLYLDANGVPTVGWGRGVQLMVPVVIWAEVPYLVYFLVAQIFMRRALRTDRATVPRVRVVLLGGLIGLAAVVGYTLFGMVTYVGPGGFGEMVAMMLALSMFTLPWLIFKAAVGAVIGALLGGLLARVLAERRS
ncbi:hypothetical protein [Thioclava pacifica]|nr:hypothetical protein [Thioclava pacifica]